jgi:CRISPR-associated protein Csy1
VGQIQAVTHVLKATHPDARGSSLHVAPDSLPAHKEIGTHLLSEDYAEDVVGNAAALDVFKFLKLEVEGRRLLDWMQSGDADLRQALHENPDTATAWMAAFSGLVHSDFRPVSHSAAKQVYWLIGEEPTDENQYHLLQPMFSSSLAHAVHADINEARFGEANKLSRQAFRDKQPFDHPYRDYRGLVARKLGGTKPQNISQLNSERGGINYLLASLPPRWTRELPRNLLSLDSALERFTYFEGVRELIKALAEFLLSDPDRNAPTRERREAIEQALGLQLTVFAASIRARFEPGWTRDPACKLPLFEKLWLDPDRLELPLREDYQDEDEEFNAAFTFGDWPDEVASRFANWVNRHLRTAGITAVGDAEYKHWAKQAIIDAALPVSMQRRAGGQP